MYQLKKLLFLVYWIPASFTVKPGTVLTVSLHQGESFPDSESAPHVQSAQLISASGVTPVQNLHERGPITLGRATIPGPGYLILSTQAGRESAKAILLSGAPDGFYRHPAGLPLEIVPESDPATVHSGDNMMVTVLLRAAPAADLLVTISSLTNEGPRTKTAGRTDAKGRIAIPIEGNGRYRVSTFTPAAQTTLTFEVQRTASH